MVLDHHFLVFKPVGLSDRFILCGLKKLIRLVDVHEKNVMVAYWRY
jgi:hypothetical protein